MNPESQGPMHDMLQAMHHVARDIMVALHIDPGGLEDGYFLYTELFPSYQSLLEDHVTPTPATIAGEAYRRLALGGHHKSVLRKEDTVKAYQSPLPPNDKSPIAFDEPFDLINITTVTPERHQGDSIIYELHEGEFSDGTKGFRIRLAHHIPKSDIIEPYLWIGTNKKDWSTLLQVHKVTRIVLLGTHIQDGQEMHARQYFNHTPDSQP